MTEIAALLSPQDSMNSSDSLSGSTPPFSTRVTGLDAPAGITVLTEVKTLLSVRATEVWSTDQRAVQAAWVETVPTRDSRVWVLIEVTLVADEVIATTGALAAPVFTTTEAVAVRVLSDTVTVIVAEVPAAVTGAVNVSRDAVAEVTPPDTVRGHVVEKEGADCTHVQPYTKPTALLLGSRSGSELPDASRLMLSPNRTDWIVPPLI